ncbi:hypothetical protein CYMTET_39184 [Cymbomonas tetramitiformis]|uniref:Uncharacterized protein n=1 Tax=Cymbomonas tetramitiformis TaxID=36881 RepID=A0AAE0F465_9CHLO|nr:hypothetical protein CYMTET_39184 [Cymbomonas tetramitiformis]
MHFKELVQETEFLKALCDLRAWCESVDTVAANGREVMLTDEGYIKYVKVHQRLDSIIISHDHDITKHKDPTELVPESTVERYGLKHYLYAFECFLRDPKVDGVALRACYDYVMLSLCECVKEKSVVSSRTFTVAYYWFHQQLTVLRQVEVGLGEMFDLRGVTYTICNMQDNFVSENVTVGDSLSFSKLPTCAWTNETHKVTDIYVCQQFQYISMETEYNDCTHQFVWFTLAHKNKLLLKFLSVSNIFTTEYGVLAPRQWFRNTKFLEKLAKQGFKKTEYLTYVREFKLFEIGLPDFVTYDLKFDYSFCAPLFRLYMVDTVEDFEKCLLKGRDDDAFAAWFDQADLNVMRSDLFRIGRWNRQKFVENVNMEVLLSAVDFMATVPLALDETDYQVVKCDQNKRQKMAWSVQEPEERHEAQLDYDNSVGCAWTG